MLLYSYQLQYTTVVNMNRKNMQFFGKYLIYILYIVV